MSGSSHLDRASNVKIGVEYQIFVIVIFFYCGQFYNLGHIQDIIRHGGLYRWRENSLPVFFISETKRDFDLV